MKTDKKTKDLGNIISRRKSDRNAVAVKRYDEHNRVVSLPKNATDEDRGDFFTEITDAISDTTDTNSPLKLVYSHDEVVVRRN